MSLFKKLKKQQLRVSALIMTFAVIFAFASCSEDNGTSVDSSTGQLTVKMTDAPIDLSLVSEANVTITKMEARRVLESEDDTANPFVEIYNETATYNLLELRNGVTEKLAEIEVPTGSYNLIRLYVEEASLTLANGMTYDVKVPSGDKTGIKVFIDPSLEVQGGLTAELLLDFDVSQSFVMKGNLETPAGVTGFNFKPVIRAVNESDAGRITGEVTDTASNVIADAAVWLENDTVVTTTYTDTSGGYALIGIKDGTYDLYAVKENYDTTQISDVTVTAGNETTKNIELQLTDTTSIN
jgi:hypothetical protein